MSPLAGIRVVEAASYVSGPFAATMLADLGADVLKIEPPKGDPYRKFGELRGDASMLFRAANQNKRKQVIDLKSPDGFAELLDLLRDADVFISNWRPSVASAIGLTAEVVRERFPSLIWVRVSGYGPDGPSADMPAYDSVIMARSGAMRIDDNAPRGANNLVADKVSAMMAAQTATSALVARSATGKGAICDVPMIDVAAYFFGADVTGGHRLADEEPDLMVARKLDPAEPLPTLDSWLIMAPVSGRQLRSALAVVGRADAWDGILAAGSAAMWQSFADVVGPVLLTKPTAEWEDLFRQADVPATAVLTFAEHMADAQVAHNNTYEQVVDPALGPYLRPRFPAFFDGERVATSGHGAPAR